jgi:LysM repeat protein
VRKAVVLALSLLAIGTPAAAGAARDLWSGTYVVRPGDSLTAIAHRYHVSMPKLAAANGLDWRKTLLAGAVLHVPSAAPLSSPWSARYLVRYGDTLSGIALHFRVPLGALARANHLDPAGVLFAGTRLRVPSGLGLGAGLDTLSESNPYAPGSIGYDVSFPNCALQLPPSSPFAVIGLNGGRPFTPNPCFLAEWSAAQPPRSVYVNTAYDDSLERHVSADCRSAALSQPLSTAAQRGYAVGCSEAEAALTLLGAIEPMVLWLDVEPDNTWSGRNEVNRAAIAGYLEHVIAAAPSIRVGIYSNAKFWKEIVGDWSLPTVPEWAAPSAVGPSGCAGSFAGGPVWLEQHVDVAGDTNVAC